MFVMIGAMLGGFASQSQAPAQESNTWYVDDDLADYPDADFTKIQDAVDAAFPGDAIVVYPGTYTENVDVYTDHLTIQSENGAETTIVQAANPDDDVFEVTVDYVTIEGFTARDAKPNKNGIHLSNVEHCSILSNLAMENDIGIYLSDSSNNALHNNTCTNNSYGMYLDRSPNNMLEDCVYLSNTYGLGIHCSADNVLRGNCLDGNEYNFGIIYGGGVGYHPQDMDTTNTVNGNPIYYFVDQSDIVIDGAMMSIGYLGFVRCTNVTVRNVQIGANFDGIVLIGTEYAAVENCTFQGNQKGISLWWSSNNQIKDCDGLNNYSYGIYIGCSSKNEVRNCCFHENGSAGICVVHTNSKDNAIHSNAISSNRVGINSCSSGNNEIYLNNFIENNEGNVYSADSTNTWNSPEQLTYTYNGDTGVSYLGNYWSDYDEKYPDAEEVDGTGIWDTPYGINADKDNYPLVEPFESYEICDPWSYDSDHSGYIEINELLNAIRHYIGGGVSISLLLDIINLYISHTHR